jgi:diguanylate cyclase (GGDEF)-like protein
MPSFDGSVTWIAVGAFALAALVVVLGVLLLRGRRNTPTEKQGGGQVLADLSRAFERAKEEAKESQAELRWIRRCSEIGATVELEGVLQRGLEAATRLANAAAAMIVLTRSEAEPLVATFGLSAEESSRELVGLPPGSGLARAVTLSYRYTEDEIDFDEFRLRGGLAVPVSEEGERIGTLAIFWRRVEREASEEELRRLEALARTLVAALRNAFEFEDVRRRLEIDPVTGLGTERALRRTLDRETARARRYERRLSLLLFRAGAATTTELLTEAGERLPPVLRSSDLACHAGNDAFAVVLPESAHADAERLFRRLELAVDSKLVDGDGSARLVAGIAELRPEDDAVSLLRRAERALGRATEEPGGERMSEALLNRVPDLPTV